MKLNIQILQNKKTAIKVGEFLTSKDAFDQTWAPEEKHHVMKAPLDSLENTNHRYWYIENEGKIVAAMGVRENKYRSGGYVMDEDYLAVHQEYRKKGIANLMLAEVEKFVKESNGRYIHVLSCDIDSYIPARAFYARNGYKRVAKIPDYYVQGEGRIDFFKEMN
jgi:ribosomal protein S18 acetylase RimI-like enzyme